VRKSGDSYGQLFIKTLCRAYPFYSGYSKLTANPLFQMLARKPSPGEEAVATICDGSRLRVRLDDQDGLTLYYLGDWDRRVTWICRRLLRPGDTVLDVGSNYGLVAIVAGRLVGPTGLVHAFEPQPRLAEMIRSSKEANGLGQVNVHTVALSESDGTLDLFVPIHHSGGSSLGGAQGSDHEKIPVEVRRASEYLEHLGVAAVRLMKIDVEGHEAQVFRGASEFFESHPPDVVLFESMDRFHRPFDPQPPFHELPTVRFLRSFGYALYSVGRSFLKVNLHKVDPDEVTHPDCCDLLAVRADASAEVLRALGA
jgi:FkbM family methyltransferase